MISIPYARIEKILPTTCTRTGEMHVRPVRVYIGLCQVYVGLFWVYIELI